MNTFHFDNANVLTSFARTVLPQRLALIRHVKLTAEYECIYLFIKPYSTRFMRNEWARACKHLQAFTSLETLHICFRIESYFAGSNVWTGFSTSKWPASIIGPLESLSASKEFVLEYVWPKRACSEWPRGTFIMRPMGDAV